MWPHSWCLLAWVWGAIQRRGQLYPVRSPHVSRRGKQKSNNWKSCLCTRHRALQTPYWCQSTMLSADAHVIRSLRLGWNLLCSFKCLQMAAHRFQQYKSWLFDWPGWWQVLLTWSKPWTAGDDAGQISGIRNDVTPAQRRCTLYKRDTGIWMRPHRVRIQVFNIYHVHGQIKQSHYIWQTNCREHLMTIHSLICYRSQYCPQIPKASSRSL